MKLKKVKPEGAGTHVCLCVHSTVYHGMDFIRHDVTKWNPGCPTHRKEPPKPKKYSRRERDERRPVKKARRKK